MSKKKNEPKFIVWFDKSYSSIEVAGPDDDGVSFREAKKELLQMLNDTVQRYREAARAVRRLTKSKVIEESRRGPQ